MNDGTPDNEAKLPGTSGLNVDAVIPVLVATDVRSAAAALRQAAVESGLPVIAVVWTELGELLFEPAAMETPAHERAAIDAFSGRALAAGDESCVPQLLEVAGSDAGVVLLLPPEYPQDRTPAQAHLLALASRRLSELFTAAHLQASVAELRQAEQLQHALFAIADIAASDHNMRSMLHGLHQTIGRLMYAENFYIALYDHQRETLRFIYSADEMDGELDPEREIPAAEFGGSLTLGLIRYGKAVRGSSEKVAELLGVAEETAIGTPAVDFMGVPMLRDGRAVGALVVQSYREGIRYTASDVAVLGFVAEHVLNAVERKRGRDELERHVVERTRELADANAQLQAQVQERERAAHLQVTMYRIAALANSQDSDADFFQSIHQAVGELINAENFYIALVSEDGKTLSFPYSVDATGIQRGSRPMGRGMSEYVIHHAKTVLADAATIDALIASGEVDASVLLGQAALAWLGVPLSTAQGVLGLVAVQSYRRDLAYSEQDAELLSFVSSQITNSLQRRRQAEALLQLNMELEQRVDERTRELRQQIEVREQVEEQLKHQVMHDSLTGLPNRVYLRDRLERALNGLKRNPKRHFALLYMDVDRFKLFNDSFGHRAGDAVLREVSCRLVECVRTPDVAARLSGDEFAILLEDCDLPATAVKVAKRIQEKLKAPILADGRELHASASIGIAIGNADHPNIDAVLHDADVALYRAKAAGRQRFVLFDETLQGAAMNVLDFEQELRRALLMGEFVPYFQPIVRMQDGVTAGYEALIRWQHPGRGLLAPGEFLPVAEETGLIAEIDWHMYKIACRAGVALVGEGRYLTLNISPRHFQSEDFDQRLLALLAEVGFDPARLRIEVTEGTLLGDPEAVARILQRLHDIGIGAALDDFGTGYSSLSHVHRFPLQMIKIDRSFVGPLDLKEGDSRRSTAVINAVLSLAQSLDLRVVAEGVETRSQCETLLAMGCTHAQGFLFGRPAAAQHWLEMAEKM